jgi:hypothetical protein
MTEETTIDPLDYSSSSTFKADYYDEHGTGNWLDDIKLEIIWREEHGKELEPYMEKLVN